MLRRMFWRVLLLAVCAAPGTSAHAAEAYQVSTISSLLAGGYDGATTIGEMLRHGNFGLGTFNSVDLDVYWPNGLHESFKQIPANQLITLREGVGAVPNRGWSK